jgi:Helix-turn-helix domain
MKEELLTVQELAAELRMSPKSIQRAYRKEEIPVQWLGRMARFDLAKVQRAMERNGRSRMRRLNGNSTSQGAIAGASRRRGPKKRPRSVTRGHYPQGLLQEVQGFHELTVHPHH